MTSFKVIFIVATYTKRADQQMASTVRKKYMVESLSGETMLQEDWAAKLVYRIGEIRAAKSRFPYPSELSNLSYHF